MSEQVRIGDLVLDFDILPREVHPLYVSQLCDALNSGSTLPAIKVDRTTRKIVSGAHRYTAHRNLYGDDGYIGVEFHDYENSDAMFLAAVEENIANAHPLSSFEKRSAVLKMQEMGLPLEKAASIVQIPVKDLERRTLVGYKIERHPVTGEPVRRMAVLKRSFEHLDGQTLTDEQWEAHKHAIGFQVTAMLRNLTKYAEQDMLDRSSGAVVVDVRHCVEALNGWLAAFPPAGKEEAA